jgi:hypothetical protein
MSRKRFIAPSSGSDENAWLCAGQSEIEKEQEPTVAAQAALADIITLITTIPRYSIFTTKVTVPVWLGESVPVKSH